eukprot:2368973-Rhodomonas_salina.1
MLAPAALLRAPHAPTPPTRARTTCHPLPPTHTLHTVSSVLTRSHAVGRGCVQGRGAFPGHGGELRRGGPRRGEHLPPRPRWRPRQRD